MKLVRINEAIKGAANRLILKIQGVGKEDVQTSYNAANFGVDSSPIKNMLAVYSPTGVDGETVIIGYIKKEALAEPGETHIYSTDANGADSFRAKFLTDGTAQIGGDSKHMVRYEELETAFNSLKTSVTDLTNAFNTHQHATAATGPPVPPTPVPSVIPATPPTADVTGAKITEIKTL